MMQLTAELGITRHCPSCRRMAQQMNEWGAEGCHANRDAILTHLRSAYADLTLADVATMAAKAVTIGFAINPFDPAASLLSEAVRRVGVGAN